MKKNFVNFGLILMSFAILESWSQEEFINNPIGTIESPQNFGLLFCEVKILTSVWSGSFDLSDLKLGIGF